MNDRNKAKNQRGVLIIWLALFLLVLIGFVSVGVDLAKLAATQAQLQTAADAAALAGATAADSLTGKIITVEATARALETASHNKAYHLIPDSLVAGDVDIWFPNDTTIHVVTKRVQGDGSGGMITHFAAAFLGPAMHTLDMKASAEAILIRPSTVCGKLFPMGAVQPTQGGDFQPGCGHQYTLRLGSGTNGNWGMVDYPACDQGPCAGMPSTGANTLRCLIENGYWCCIDMNDPLTTEPGSKSGPVIQGMQTRWDADSDQRNNICYEQYTGNQQRVVTVPITSPFPNGRGQVTVQGFANFFLLQRPTIGSDAIMGEFIEKTNPGSGGGGNGTALAVKLVK